MRRSTRRAIFASLVACVAACGLFPDLEGLSGSDAGGDVSIADAPQSESGGDAGADATLDAPADVLDAGTLSDAGPSGRGPVMAKLDSKTCIDTTEVTVAQYRAFVSAVDGGFPQAPECSWNATFTPLGGVPATSKDTYPIANINWCQAQAFCAWSGKALCGAADGGPYTYLAFGTTQSTWMNACSADNAQAYPYGPTFKAGACNIPVTDADAPVAPVASFSGCVGALPGVFDMVGNIKEWDNACLPSGTDAAADLCRRRGAGFDDPGPGATKKCNWDEVDTRDHQSFTSGVRCCAYLP